MADADERTAGRWLDATGSSRRRRSARVIAARERQRMRYAELGIGNNAELAPGQVRHFCALDDAGAAVLRDACLKRQFSPRAFDRIARVARTIADLGCAENIAREHVAEEIGYRSLERLGARRVA